MDHILVTGGAGYVGSHTCLRLAEAGFTPIVFDNLSNGHARFVQWGPLEKGDIGDRDRLDEVFAKWKPVAVVHFAALIEVGESIRHPGRFFATNVGGAVNLIEAARRGGVSAFVFSSTCAIFGLPQQAAMNESHPRAPLNPYGRSKLMVEQVLEDMDRYAGFRSARLRYFNAAGGDPEGRIGERHEPETHAIPLALQAALGQRDRFSLFGTDYATRDGTAVRDYVHVLDLADAHVLALKRLLAGGESEAFNLGTGTGTTVRELVDTIREVSGRPFPVDEAPRRDGDAPVLVADNRRAREALGWSPRYGLRHIIRHALDWHAIHESRVFGP